MTIDERISAELRRHAPEVDEHAAWDQIRSRAPVHRRLRTIRLVAVPVAGAGLFLMASVLLSTLTSSPEPVGNPQSPLLGTWVSIDGDLSQPIMVIELSTDGVVEMLVVDDDLDDDFASVCSGASSTMTATGQFEGDNMLVFPSPVLTCDDGSQPEARSGPPLGEQLQNLTFTYRPESDTLIDKFGERWTREGVQSTLVPMIRWPQASVEEVREAQQLADAGDPNFTWQLEPNMESLAAPDAVAAGEVPELLARALQKRFGWEATALIGPSGTAESEGIRAISLQLVRCEPGKANPLWPNDQLLGACAPTINDFTYETVELFVSQPGVQGPEGIWVVSTMPSEVSTMAQIAPITADEVTAIMEAFLQARIEGEGAERYLGPTNIQHVETGYLYATSTGAPYERAEFELEDEEIADQGPLGGGIGMLVRLFADGGQTVVEQSFVLEWHMAEGRWLLYQHDDDLNLENGVPPPPP